MMAQPAFRRRSIGSGTSLPNDRVVTRTVSCDISRAPSERANPRRSRGALQGCLLACEAVLYWLCKQGRLASSRRLGHDTDSPRPRTLVPNSRRPPTWPRRSRNPRRGWPQRPTGIRASTRSSRPGISRRAWGVRPVSIQRAGGHPGPRDSARAGVPSRPR